MRTKTIKILEGNKGNFGLAKFHNTMQEVQIIHSSKKKVFKSLPFKGHLYEDVKTSQRLGENTCKTYPTIDSSVHGILQARMLEWVAISFSR